MKRTNEPSTAPSMKHDDYFPTITKIHPIGDVYTYDVKNALRKKRLEPKDEQTDAPSKLTYKDLNRASDLDLN